MITNSEVRESDGGRYSIPYVCFFKNLEVLLIALCNLTELVPILTERIMHIGKELIFTFAYYLWQQANINLSHDYNNCSLEYNDGLLKRTQQLQLACRWMTVSFKLFQQCYICQHWPAHMQYPYWHFEATYHNRPPNVIYEAWHSPWKSYICSKCFILLVYKAVICFCHKELWVYDANAHSIQLLFKCLNVIDRSI